MIRNRSAPLFRTALSIQNHRASITSRRSDNYNLRRVVFPPYFLSPARPPSHPLSPLSYLAREIARVRVRPRDALTPVDPSTGRASSNNTLPYPFLSFALVVFPSRRHSSVLAPPPFPPVGPAPPSPYSSEDLSAQGTRGWEKTEAHVYRLMMKIVQ